MPPDWERSADGLRLHQEKWRGRKSATRKIRSANNELSPLDDIPAEQRAFIERWAKQTASERRIEALMSRIPFARAAIAEQAIETLVDRGWIDLVERYSDGSWRRAAISFRNLDGLRASLGLVDTGAAWRKACAESDWIPSACVDLLAAREHSVGTRSADEVLLRWKILIDPTVRVLYLREAAALAFWGWSKALDDRLELVNQLRFAAGLAPLLAMPIFLNVHVRDSRSDAGTLFVENQVAFEAVRCGRLAAALEMDLVFSSGFKASAARLRNRESVSIYASESSSAEGLARFKDWFFSSTQHRPVYFWGDLDFSGLSILKSLRATFPNLEAWQPGYAPMVEKLLVEGGHLPEETNKEDQREPGITGCQYADTVLLAAIKKTGMFLDQESYLFTPPDPSVEPRLIDCPRIEPRN